MFPGVGKDKHKELNDSKGGRALTMIITMKNT